MTEACVAGVRVAEVVATLSLATDLGMGQPDQYAIRSTILAVRLADALGYPDDELVDTYYLAMLRYAGCTADAHVAADVFGDELTFRRDFATVDMNPTALLAAMVTTLGADQPWPRRLRTLTHALAGMPRLAGTAQAHCEVGQRIAARLGLGMRLQRSLAQVFERWDGRGWPNRVRGDAIERPMRVVALAQDAETFRRIGGVEAAVAVVRQRSGGAYGPAIAACFCREGPRLLGIAEIPSVWEAVLAAEPGPHPMLRGEQLDDALHAMAYFADLKSPYTVGHSTGVARLAAGAARQCRLPDPDATLLRRAALVHDLGRVGVSAAIWHKPGALSDEEWEQVRLHPYFGERVVSRSRVLAPLGALASTHHERLDGSGYHRGLPAASLSLPARILAAADVYQALTEERPYRPARRSPGEAAEELRREVRRGRLDPEAVQAVLVAAGHRLGRRRPWPAGLTEREVEVLRLLARGRPNRQIARALTISEKTVDHHVQHIYDKLGVATRPAAMLFAMHHDLLGNGADPGAG